MDKVIREVAVRVEVDLAKQVIQVHAVDAGGRVLTSRALARAKFVEPWSTSGSSSAVRSSAPGSAWFRASTPVVARAGSGALPSAATST